MSCCHGRFSLDQRKVTYPVTRFDQAAIFNIKYSHRQSWVCLISEKQTSFWCIPYEERKQDQLQAVNFGVVGESHSSTVIAYKVAEW